MTHPEPSKGLVADLKQYDTIALLLQGGGALGSYQAGVIEGLARAGIRPNWIAGISIGAINTALIAGNPPERRVERLREFWNTVCQPSFFRLMPEWVENLLFNHGNDTQRMALTSIQAARTLIEGQRGFFLPRMPPPAFGNQQPDQNSFYDTTPLQATLERLCDFNRINDGDIAVSVGAVNVRNGNFTYFENRGPNRVRLNAAHIMASGALPPGFPAVCIDGEYYWDGGLVSNTPLDHLYRATCTPATLAFQVDLWSARGELPTNMFDTHSRVKDIQYSSRTRMITDQLERTVRTRKLLHELLAAVPEAIRRKNRWCQQADLIVDDRRFNVIHLIYRQKAYESHYKDYQFGLTTMREHWESGLADALHTLERTEWLALPGEDAPFVTHDIHRRQKS